MYLYKKNIDHIHNYVQKSMNCSFLSVTSFVSDIALLFLNLWENLLVKDLLTKKRSNSNLNADRSNFLANRTVRLVLGLYV